MLHNLTGWHVIHEHNTRYKFYLDIPYHRLAKSSHSFKVNCVNCFNRLSESAFLAVNNSFKTKLNNWLLDNSFMYFIKEILDFKIYIVLTLCILFRFSKFNYSTAICLTMPIPFSKGQRQ